MLISSCVSVAFKKYKLLCLLMEGCNKDSLLTLSSNNSENGIIAILTSLTNMMINLEVCVEDNRYKRRRFNFVI